MIKTLFLSVFLIGALAILWIGQLFLGVDNLGLGVTILIAAVYGVGTLELLQFRRATESLDRILSTLNDPIEDLGRWLENLDPSLQSAVRLRIEGQRNGLPAPTVTPYLVGLLVMLGLLGTFVGMVDTLKGAVVALEGNSELEAIRSGLTAPIQGLGLAFGTSVAGVAASAMLGLMSTISRRDRLQASHLLDAQLGSVLRDFSGRHQRQLAFNAMQNQAHALPKVATELSALTAKLDLMSDDMLNRQEQFHTNMADLYKTLNEFLDRSLKASITESSNLVNESVQTFAESTLSNINNATVKTQQHLQNVCEQQLSAVGEAINVSNEVLRQAQETSLEEQRANTQKISKSLEGISQQWVTQQREQASQFSTIVSGKLDALHDAESKRGDAAIERLGELQEAVAANLEELSSAFEEPMASLIGSVSEAPKAASELIEKLRHQMNEHLTRDNNLLLQRNHMTEQFDVLSKTLVDSSNQQRDALERMIEHSSETFGRAQSQFSERVDGEASKLAAMVDHFSNSTSEMASLGDVFNTAVLQFSDANKQLIDKLGRIEASLEQSSSRSDEQLAYYVAQAREIIDHNLLAHKQIIDAVTALQVDTTNVKRVI